VVVFCCGTTESSPRSRPPTQSRLALRAQQNISSLFGFRSVGTLFFAELSAKRNGIGSSKQEGIEGRSWTCF